MGGVLDIGVIAQWVAAGGGSGSTLTGFTAVVWRSMTIGTLLFGVFCSKVVFAPKIIVGEQIRIVHFHWVPIDVGCSGIQCT